MSIPELNIVLEWASIVQRLVIKSINCFSSFFFIRNGQNILIVGYGESYESVGLPFGSIGVIGAVGLFSVFVAGTKGYFLYWKTV